MTNLKDKLLRLASEKPSDWKAKAEFRRENQAWLKKSAFIAMKVLDALRVNDLSQTDLAKKMNVSPQQINKIVKGNENLTLETISNLEKALGIEILVEGSIREKKGKKRRAA